jgi:tRNA-specific 2-thiouridylase
MTSCVTPIITPDPALQQLADSYVVAPAANPKRVVVAMSGGVDSSVAAWLLKEAGHDVIGVSLRLAPDDPGALNVRHGRCCSVDDMTDARQVCDRLGIPFYAIDSRERFKKVVFDPFVKAYRSGQTPIPCLACNHDVKFGDLYKTAKSLGASLATGHYARVVDYKGKRTLARPDDLNRDQTYYLYGTDPEVLENLELPLGELEKPFIRALARRMGMAVHNKPDSHEICFVPDGNHARVVEKAGGPVPKGELQSLDGAKIAEHPGVHHFTIGQRRGIGVGVGERAYVVDIDASTDVVTLGPKNALDCTRIKAGPLRLAVATELWPAEVLVQIRARHRATPATWALGEGSEVYFTFTDKTSAVALGQAAVVYDGDVLLGGGLITGRLDGLRPRVI